MHQEPHIVSLFEQAIAQSPTTPSSLTDQQREALEAAKAGDWDKANAMELAYLNDAKNKIAPHDLAGEPYETEEGGTEWKAVLIIRGGAPNGQLAVRWESPCKDCDGDGTLSVSGNITQSIDCPTCKEEEAESVMTDIDGLVLEEIYIRGSTS